MYYLFFVIFFNLLQNYDKALKWLRKVKEIPGLIFRLEAMAVSRGPLLEVSEVHHLEDLEDLHLEDLKDHHLEDSPSRLQQTITKFLHP